MVSVDNMTAANLLKRDTYRYLGDLMALELNMPPIPRRVFADSKQPTVAMVVEEYPWGIGATLSSFDEKFVCECLDWLQGSFDKFGFWSTDQRAVDYAAKRPDLAVVPIRCTRSFVCTSLESVPEIIQASKLTQADRDAVERYPPEHRRSGPSVAEMFQSFVLEGRGEILACMEGDEILGYLSCAKEYENIWDVDYIHVREDARARGLGVRLAASYARERLGRAEIPYYSGAANEPSERTAISAGFHCCRELFDADVCANP